MGTTNTKSQTQTIHQDLNNSIKSYKNSPTHILLNNKSKSYDKLKFMNNKFHNQKNINFINNNENFKLNKTNLNKTDKCLKSSYNSDICNYKNKKYYSHNNNKQINYQNNFKSIKSINKFYDINQNLNEKDLNNLDKLKHFKSNQENINDDINNVINDLQQNKNVDNNNDDDEIVENSKTHTTTINRINSNNKQCYRGDENYTLQNDKFKSITNKITNNFVDSNSLPNNNQINSIINRKLSINKDYENNENLNEIGSKLSRGDMKQNSVHYQQQQSQKLEENDQESKSNEKHKSVTLRPTTISNLSNKPPTPPPKFYNLRAITPISQPNMKSNKLLTNLSPKSCSTSIRSKLNNSPKLKHETNDPRYQTNLDDLSQRPLTADPWTSNLFANLIPANPNIKSVKTKNKANDLTKSKKIPKVNNFDNESYQEKSNCLARIEYTFYINDTESYQRPFFDRRVEAIAKSSQCSVCLHKPPPGHKPVFYKGMRVLPVTISARTMVSLKRCLARLDMQYPYFNVKAFCPPDMY